MPLNANTFFDTRIGDVTLVTQVRVPRTLTTVGAGTLLAALLADGVVIRSGPTGPFTDTTDTAAAIQAAWPGGAVGSTFSFTYQNTSSQTATLAGGTGVTLSGTVPTNGWANFIVQWTAAGITFTRTGYGLLS